VLQESGYGTGRRGCSTSPTVHSSGEPSTTQEGRLRLTAVDYRLGA
jgi:hypothetical protein